MQIHSCPIISHERTGGQRQRVRGGAAKADEDDYHSRVAKSTRETA